jgi:hypothetical protein
MLRTARTPLRRVWRLAYRAAVWLAVAYLTAGRRRASAYARGSVGGEDFLPGLSDIDVAIVVAPHRAGEGIARDRTAERWERLRRVVPAFARLLDYPRIYEEGDLPGLMGRSAPTYGLDEPDGERAALFGPDAVTDRVRMLERPGLHGATADWRLLRGPERRPALPAPSRQEQRIEAWLELVAWWQWAFGACVEPSGAHTAHLCLKLVAEPARIWLWLAHGERPAGRVAALQRALALLPEEEDAFRGAIELHRALPGAPPAPLARALPAFVRMSARIEALIAAELQDAALTEVQLAGGDPILAHARRRAVGEEVVALCDWRALVWPGLPDDVLAPHPGDPGDPVVLGATAAKQQAGIYPALRAGGLLVLPAAVRWRSRMRAVQCAATDPVSFAQLAGETVARFPDVAGWSARDTARRAVAEQRAALTAAGDDDPGRALGGLLTAARAALFAEHLDAGEPALAVTASETARRLAARSTSAAAVADDALGCYEQFALHRTEPPRATIAALRDLVLGLPAYRG